MSAAREAVFLPLCLLTVALLGGLQPGGREPLATPPLFTLVLAVLLMAVLVRSGTVHGNRLLHGSRSVLENANGASVMVTLFAASAQLFNLMTPRAGLPMVTVSTCLFVLLLNTLVAAPDRVRVLRSLFVICGAAFVLKFIVLDALADPEGGRMRRMLTALFDVATLGTVSQEPLSPLAGYIAFFTIALYLIAVALLPHGGPHATGESRIAIGDVPRSGPPYR
jgi:phage shock protein PspC (stress-responsive transcriptional regulator)